MGERVILFLIGLGLAGLSALFIDGAHSNHAKLTLYGDFAQWQRSAGTLKSLELWPTSSGRNQGFAVHCEYTFVFAGTPYKGSTFHLGYVPTIGAPTVRAKVERVLGIADRAKWVAVQRDRFDGWALQAQGMPISVTHSAHYPASASTLNPESEPLPAYLYWPLIVVTAVLGLATGVASLVFLFIACVIDAPGDSLKDPAWRELLFRDHPKRRLREWARSMRYFRFIRGPGGGMGDHGDRLLVGLKADSAAEIEQIFSTLGAASKPLPANSRTAHLQFVPGTAAGGDHPAHESAAQPQAWTQVADAKVSAYLTFGRLELSITDDQDPNNVTQAAVDAARSVEIRLDALASRVIDPPQHDRHCVSPKFYPSFWEDDSPAAVAAALAQRWRQRRRQAWRMLGGGLALLLGASMAGWQLAIEAPVRPFSGGTVLAVLYGFGGALVTIGVFLAPGIFLLVRARRAFKQLKRQQARQAKRAR